MYINDNSVKYINIEIQMQIKKTVYLQEMEKLNNKSQNIPFKKKKNLPKFQNADKIDNCCSLNVHDFEIKYINDNNTIKSNQCLFNSLPENKFNPFLSYEQLNDWNQKQIIDLKSVNNIQEPDFLLLDDVLSQ